MPASASVYHVETQKSSSTPKGCGDGHKHRCDDMWVELIHICVSFWIDKCRKSTNSFLHSITIKRLFVINEQITSSIRFISRSHFPDKLLATNELFAYICHST